ncbi:hypothetical protein [Primorskyibacter flagellatus]|uniref:Uncharacterized protein n=1 Tax=Primorskyibacter flagellatus TaxID=1387277 RepID=A0A1W2ELV8_9RHOB|nr:hypothetical protein [Primorskyibacter flagellatus]SMD10707.1 hypothetical protein SAMN06295998_13315 [Primorskyibacter flagellatus]
MTKKDENSNKDLLTIELAHIAWYVQRGKFIKDPEELHAAWRDDHIEATKLSQEIIAEMYARGMLLSFFDKSLALFARAEDSDK